MDTNGTVTKAIYDALVEDSKVNEYTRFIHEAKVQAEVDARAVLDMYVSIEEINQLEK